MRGATVRDREHKRRRCWGEGNPFFFWTYCFTGVYEASVRSQLSGKSLAIWNRNKRKAPQSGVSTYRWHLEGRSRTGEAQIVERTVGRGPSPGEPYFLRQVEEEEAAKEPKKDPQH